MVDLVAVGEVTRTELALADLVLSPANGYFIQRDGFGPGEVSWRRQTAESVFVPGRVLVHAVKEQQTSTLNIRVEGSSNAVLHTRMNALIAAMEQFSYTLSVTIDATEYSYLCEPADWVVGDGGNIQDLWIRSDTQVLSFSVPHYPVVSGL